MDIIRVINGFQRQLWELRKAGKLPDRFTVQYVRGGGLETTVLCVRIIDALKRPHYVELNIISGEVVRDLTKEQAQEIKHAMHAEGITP